VDSFTWHTIAAVLGLCAGMAEARISVALMRGNIPDQNPVIVILGVASFLAFLATLVWFFMTWTWWLTLIVFVAISFTVGWAVRQSTFAFFVGLRGMLALSSIAAAVIVWTHGVE
jgi:hypothetical protein